MTVVVNEEVAWVVEVEDEPSVVEITKDQIDVVGVAEQGPQGTPGYVGADGPPGPQGPAGPPGPSGDTYYTHDQGLPASLWSVTHNMGKMPSVTVVDSAGSEVEGEITYINANSLTIEFGVSFSGRAYLN